LKVAGKDTSRHPVETVSWDDSVEFCRRLSNTPPERAAKRTYRLPTEAQWEYACRAGTKTQWPWGDDEYGFFAHGWFVANSNSATQPVGQKKPNGFGLYDFQGNVWEWCSDWFNLEYYRQSPSNDPSGPSSGSERVVRGGCWSDNPYYCRSAFRLWSRPETRSPAFGIRVLCEIGTQ
jgi:formylglycine-generating enzyme required for sulfatase activity